MQSSNFINVSKIFSDTILASGIKESGAIDVQYCGGSVSLQLTITGTGVLQVDAEYSNDGLTYYVPQGYSALATGLVLTSGPGANGNLLISWSITASKYMKVKLTETGGAASVTVVGTIAVQ